MKGHKRFRACAWRPTVNAKDPVTGQRKPVYRTVHAPNTKRGSEKADTELAKLVAEVDTGRTMPTSGLSVEQLAERYIVDKSPGWSLGAADETRRRVAQHVTPHIGAIAIERLRRIDVQQLHATLRAGGLGEGSIGRVHDVLRATLNWAERLDLIVKNPAAKVDRPRGAKPDIRPAASASDGLDVDAVAEVRIPPHHPAQACVLGVGDDELTRVPFEETVFFPSSP